MARRHIKRHRKKALFFIGDILLRVATLEPVEEGDIVVEMRRTMRVTTICCCVLWEKGRKMTAALK